MSRKTVKIKFVDAWPGFVPEESSIYHAIAQTHDIVLCDNPDYLIVQPYGHEHLKYDCVKIFFTGENATPDFNLFDYAIGFDYLEFGDRYLRAPLWSIVKRYRDRGQFAMPSDEALLNRGFCSFVVSNSRGEDIRARFYHALSKYKRVDSGGYYLNNVGGPVKDKMTFISRYKFNIAFENSEYSGYTTEKIMEPFVAHTVPIYWGDPLIERDFNNKAFVRMVGKDDIEKTVEEVIRLDKDDEAYLKMCKESYSVRPDADIYWKRLVQFFGNIMDQSLDCAKRVATNGYQEAFYRNSLKKAFKAYDISCMPLNMYRRVRSLLRCK